MTNPTGDAPRHAVIERLDASIEKNVALDVASMSPEMRERYRAALSLPTGDALKVSAAPYTNAQKRVYAALSEEGGGTWATYMMQDIEAAFALSPPVEQAPQPVATETQQIGFMDVNGLEALVDEVRSRPTPTEAPPVESQAAEIRAKALEEAAKIADAAGIEWAADAELWLKDGHPNTAAVSKQHSRAAENVAASIRAALAAEGSAE